MKVSDGLFNKETRSADLQCKWERWEVVGDSGLAVFVPEGNATDMSGTIRAAKSLMPDVSIVGVYWGRQLDVVYFMGKDGSWAAFDARRRAMKMNQNGGAE